ncbi:VOC family protein [Pseudonocardia hispaniensis]|uniref:VOC family protein n=1 Tax=Pseudonocardia hispaniensis TaxID=904933 RepID=A0ABW1J1A2_9PSEU
MSDILSPVPVPALDAQAPGISRAIYGMPMFVSLSAVDLDATLGWYVDGLGFVNLFTVPGPDGRPALVHLRRWQFQDLLVRPAAGPVTPGSGCAVSFAAVYGEIDALAERARAHGGGRVEGPIDTPWNSRDLTTVDPNGYTVIFTAGRPPELADQEFTDRMRQWNAEQSIER